MTYTPYLITTIGCIYPPTLVHCGTGPVAAQSVQTLPPPTFLLGCHTAVQHCGTVAAAQPQASSPYPTATTTVQAQFVTVTPICNTSILPTVLTTVANPGQGAAAQAAALPQHTISSPYLPAVTSGLQPTVFNCQTPITGTGPVAAQAAALPQQAISSPYQPTATTTVLPTFMHCVTGVTPYCGAGAAPQAAALPHTLSSIHYTGTSLSSVLPVQNTTVAATVISSPVTTHFPVHHTALEICSTVALPNGQNAQAAAVNVTTLPTTSGPCLPYTLVNCQVQAPIQNTVVSPSLTSPCLPFTTGPGPAHAIQPTVQGQAAAVNVTTLPTTSGPCLPYTLVNCQAQAQVQNTAVAASLTISCLPFNTGLGPAHAVQPTVQAQAAGAQTIVGPTAYLHCNSGIPGCHTSIQGCTVNTTVEGQAGRPVTSIGCGTIATVCNPTHIHCTGA